MARLESQDVASSGRWPVPLHGSRLRVRFGASLTLSAATLLLLAACGHEAEPPPPVRPAVFEHPQALTGGDVEVYPGSVRARVETDLAFRVPGKISARRVDAGATVQAGQVLATLDPEDSQLNVAAARTSVAATEADANLAHAELKRNQDLLAKGFVSQSVIDARENATKLADARLNEAKARLSLVENQSRYTQLASDRKGVVTSVLAEAGQVVAAGQPVFRVAQQGQREIVINVPEGGVDRLAKAGALRISLWAQPDKQYTGHVREISPQADPMTRTHEARITVVDADDEVKLGMTATVYAGGAVGETVYRLPLTALGGDTKQAAVWLIVNGHVKPVPVEVVQYLADAAIVRGPLKPEDLVVCAGVHLLVDGQAVRPVARTRPVRST